jgi:hypothetical protein
MSILRFYSHKKCLDDHKLRRSLADSYHSDPPKSPSHKDQTQTPIRMKHTGFCYNWTLIHSIWTGLQFDVMNVDRFMTSSKPAA